MPRETAAVSAQVLCTPYNHAPVYKDTATFRECMCLVATCHLHFWQNDRGLLRAVTRGGGTDTEIRVNTES